MAKNFDDDWDLWMEITDPRKVARRMKTYFRRAHVRIGLDYRRIARGMIRSGKYTPNSALTIALKGSSLPLVDTGDLLGDITYDLRRGHRELRVGVARSEMKGKRQLYEILHDGATIKVTRAMLFAVMMKLRALQKGGKFKGNSKTARKQHEGDVASSLKSFKSAAATGTWKIPARPFTTAPLESAEFVGAVDKHYGEAIELVMFEPVDEFKAKAKKARAEAKKRRVAGGKTRGRRRKAKAKRSRRRQR